MNPIKQLFGQTLVYGMGIVLPRLLNYLLLTPFYTRIFNPGEYGVITELYAYVVFLLVILTYGLETGFFRYASDDKKNLPVVYKTVLTSIFFTTIGFLIFVTIFNGSISGFLGYTNDSQFIQWVAIIVAIDAFTSIPFALIRIQSKPVKYAVIRIIEVSVNIGLNWFFLLYCPLHKENGFIEEFYNPDIGIGYVLISNLTASIIKLLLLSKELLTHLRASVNYLLFKKILRYSLPLLIAGLAGTINEALDRVLLKHLISEDNLPMYQLGIYGANYKIAVLMTLYVQMFKYAAEPFFFSKAKERDAKILYADIMKYFIVIGLLIFITVTYFIDYFVLFIGKDFREGVEIVPIILMANLVMGVFFNLSIWYKLSDKTLFGAALVTIGAIITIVINIIFIPKYGYIASAWAHLISYSVMVVSSYLLSMRRYKIYYEFKRIAGYVTMIVAFYLFDKFYIRTELNNSLILKILIIGMIVYVFYYLERKKLLAYGKIK